MEKTKAKPVLTETGNSDAESTGLTNAAQIARKLNNEDKEIDMSKFHKSNNSVPAASSAAIFYGRHPVAAAIANPPQADKQNSLYRRKRRRTTPPLHGKPPDARSG